MQQAPDAAHLLRAWQDGFILVSRDHDYRELHYAWLHWPAAWQVPRPQSHPGILLIHSNWPALRVAHELELFVQSGRPLANQLYQYVLGRGWVPHP